MNTSEQWRSSGHEQLLFCKIRSKAEIYHERIPFIRRLPGAAIGIVLLLVAINILVWVACGIVLSFHVGLVSTSVLSYILGLRHALDADHISAIDLMTRRLVATGQRHVTVGTFFSLGPLYHRNCYIHCCGSKLSSHL